MKSLLSRRAPLFSACDIDGNAFVLADAIAQGPVALVFFPKAFTTVCTAQACAFRGTTLPEQAAGTQVVGVAPDAPAVLKRFQAQHALGYRLIADQDLLLFRQYGVLLPWVGLPGRGSFLISSDGVVIKEVRALLRAAPHHKLAQSLA